MDFGAALTAMKMGSRVKRKIWGVSMLRLWRLNPHPLELWSDTYNGHGAWLPYLPSVNDVLAEDWEAID